MAVGKAKKQTKTKKGGKKKITDPFNKKEWYEVRAPSVFPIKHVGRTIVTKTSGTKVARDSLLGRVFEISLGDLKPDGEDEAFRKFRLRVEEVNGRNCLTNFCGMNITTDKLRSLVKKWQSLIEAFADIKTTDGYTLRMFSIGFTRKQLNARPSRMKWYAQTSQIKRIRKRMVDIMHKQTNGLDLHGVVDKLMNEAIGKEIEKRCQSIYPLYNVLIRKVKMLRAPKTDLSKLLELHGGLDSLLQGAPEPVKKADVGQAVGADAKKGKKAKGGSAATVGGSKKKKEKKGEEEEEAGDDE